MKKINIIFAILWTLTIQGQITLNTQETGSKTVVDFTSITMTDGFHAQPSDNTKVFVAKIYGSNSIHTKSSIAGNHNYIKTTLYKNQNATNPITMMDYYDGLGRPMQRIELAQSSSGMDIVTPIAYDIYGRRDKEYLKYASTQSSLEYRDNQLNEVLGFYNQSTYDNTSNPFTQRLLENSPIDRVAKEAAPGNPWAMGSGHEVKLDYRTNDANEVKLYKINASWNTSLGYYEISWVETGTNFYSENTLSKTITRDENWTSGNDYSLIEYKDKLGRTVLIRRYNNNQSHDLYYVYDPFGNVAFVIPPIADGNVSSSSLDALCYQYRYDHRNRLVEKKLPSKTWEYQVYDDRDRLVASGPTLSPFRNQTQTGWLCQKYDVYNRPAYSVWYASTASRMSMQSSYNAASQMHEQLSSSTTIEGISVGYTNQVFPTSDIYLMKIDYYDDYSYPNAPTAVTGQVETQPITTNTKSLVTGSWIRVPTISSETLHQKSYTLYDEKARPIRSYTQNHIGGYTQSDILLDFVGKVLKKVTKHKRTTSSTEETLTDSYTYTQQDRPDGHIQRIGTGNPPQLIAKNSYDPLGRLISKKIGGLDQTGTNALQKVDYSYNIRGWLRAINNPDNLLQGNDLFALKLNYETVDDNLANTISPQYGGNIAEAYWKSSKDNVLRKYGYRYDALNRLLAARYQKPGSAIPVPASYDEEVNYDKGDNITSLLRQTGLYEESQNPGSNPLYETIDDLEYSYSSTNPNQLAKVLDKSGHLMGFQEPLDAGVSIVGGQRQDNDDDYQYDAYGNMISDQNKGISQIKYNHLHLPIDILMPNGKHIVYEYNALGEKMSKYVYDGVSTTPIRTDYLEGFQYQDAVLDIISHPEGYIKSDVNTGMVYIYNMTDHLGNIRMSYKQTSTGLAILQENHYYPFGWKHSGYNTINNQAGYKYRYSGKEYQDDYNLNTYDYGARHYMLDVGRWGVVDPLADVPHSIGMSPYCAMANNPIRYIDPDGADWVEGKDGGVRWYNNVTAKNYQDKGILGEGEIYRGTTFAREATWNNRFANGYGMEVYGDNKKVTFYQANEQGMLQLPVDNPSVQNSQFTVGSSVLYSNYNRNDEIGPEDQWGRPRYIANMINSIVEYKNTYKNDVISIGDMLSPSDGEVPKNNKGGMHHADVGTFDVRLLGSGGSYQGDVFDSRFDGERTQAFINALGNHGFKRFLIGPSASDQFKNSGSIDVINGGHVHDNHYHIDMGKR